MSDPRLSSPAAQRNAGPIIAVLRDVLPVVGMVLEIASGTGEHVAVFAAAFPMLIFQPSDPSAESRASVAAWSEGLSNVLSPIALDAAVSDWPVTPADAILCVNMVHISPWAATIGLMAGAGRLLAPGAPLFLYGPYRRTGVPTASSNEAFDESLRARDPSWGLRDLGAVLREGEANRLFLDRIVEMPANNLSVVLRRA